MKPTKIFVHWYWRDGKEDCKLIIGRQRAASYIRWLRSVGIRVIWTIYP